MDHPQILNWVQKMMNQFSETEGEMKQGKTVTVKLGYNKLGYNKPPIIKNKFFRGE